MESELTMLSGRRVSTLCARAVYMKACPYSLVFDLQSQRQSYDHAADRLHSF